MASNRTRQITLHAAGIRTALSPSLLTFQSARPAGSHSRAVRFETRTRHQNFIFTACAAALATNFGWPIRSFLVRLNSLQKHHEASHVQLNLLVCLVTGKSDAATALQPPARQLLYTSISTLSGTYDHTHWNIRDPVRSPLVKPVRAGLVVGSVTTSEYLVLYVFFFCTLPPFHLLYTIYFS